MIIPLVFDDIKIPKTATAQRNNALQWALRKAFEDFYKSIQITFKELYKCLKANRISDPLSTKEELFNKINKIQREIEFKGVTIILEQIEGLVRVRFTFKPEIESIRRFRHCLVHRDGIVGKADLIEDKLVLRYHSYPTYSIIDNEERLIDLSMRKGNVSLSSPTIVKQLSKTKEFSLGEELILDIDIFNDLCSSLFIYMSTIIKTTIPSAEINLAILKNPEPDGQK